MGARGLMLSRVAESLYWTARYVERAEDTSRLLDVTFHALLDTRVDEREAVWQRMVATLGDDALYREHFEAYRAADVADWVLWHDANPSAVANCVTRARENARSVREQVSGEMWEAINGLFLLVRGANRQAVSRGPHTFHERLRAGAHLFQGTADATMTHGDPYEFIRLGLHLERASTTARIVRSHYPVAVAVAEGDPARPRELVSLLKSCSAFEAYVRRHGTLFEPLTVAEELVRSHDFPRAVRACLETCRASVERISGEAGAQHRILGRLCADLQYGEVSDVSGPAIEQTLGALLAGIHATGDALTKAYFSSRAVPAGTVTQEGQQQQCG